MKTFRIIVIVLLGILLGVGVYTFVYAKGYSYMLDDPKACINCHVMQDHYDRWQKSSHRNSTCNDCHTPTHPVWKYVSKAENGFWHSKGFTLMDFPDPIVIRPVNQKVLQANCIRCHGDVTHALPKQKSLEEFSCLHCHSEVGHGSKK
ncbi:MAG: cytochrome c nitrite reductase small subunit [Candidatus Cloacimonetes bacterium]|nr:cytochrome c nitrite reductase small subunit [Candidatus Cloacimonadota bacterium]